nr:BON domain-containing protein [Burkholderia singularis]
MKRRYPEPGAGRQLERQRPPDWPARDEWAWRGIGEPDMAGYDESLLPDDSREFAYRFASDDDSPPHWGGEWGEPPPRPLPQVGRRDAGWRGAPAGYARERGYGEPDRRADGRRGGNEQAAYRGHFRIGRYIDEPDDGGARQPVGEAHGLSRCGAGGECDTLRHRQGPKGYTRSDERICEDVCERLTRAFDIDVSDVSVQVRDARVELDGTVPARWMKHGIEDIADSCMGVRDVDNRVRVRRDARDEDKGEAMREDSGHGDAGTVLNPSQRIVAPTPPAGRASEPDMSGREPPRR